MHYCCSRTSADDGMVRERAETLVEMRTRISLVVKLAAKAGLKRRWME